MFDFIKNTGIVNGITKKFTSMTGYIKSVDYRSKFDTTRAIVSDLFTSKDLSGKNIPIANDANGCVGKLPVYVDFIRVNLSTEEALMLDKWIQNGFSHLTRQRMERFKQVFSHFPEWRFILFGNNHFRTVAGVMVPGQDQSGREYPFVVFKVIGERYRSDQFSLVPLLVDKFCDSALTLCHTDWKEKGKDLLIEQISRLPSTEFHSNPKGLQNIANNIFDLHSIDSFWQALLPNGGAEERAEYIQIFNRKIDEVHYSTNHAPEWAIEIKLHDFAKSQLVQLFFVSLLEKMLTHDGWHGQCWLTEINGGGGRLVIFFRPVQTKDLLVLVDQESGMGNIFVINENLSKSEGALTDELAILDTGQQILESMAAGWVKLYHSNQDQDQVENGAH